MSFHIKQIKLAIISRYIFFKQNHGLTPRKYELDLFNNSTNIADDELISRFLHPGFIQKVFNKTDIHKINITGKTMDFIIYFFILVPPVYIAKHVKRIY
jgi:hypothetical protein